MKVELHLRYLLRKSYGDQRKLRWLNETLVELVPIEGTGMRDEENQTFFKIMRRDSEN